MKVAFFSNSYFPYLSGITISIGILREELELLGHTAFVVAPGYPGHVETDRRILRLPSAPAPYPGYRLVLPYSYKIFDSLRKEKIDIIHAHQPFEVGLAGLALARRLKIPFVYTFHTLFTRYSHHVPLLPEKFTKGALVAYLTWFCNQTDTVIVPSEMVRRLLVRRKVKKPIQVLPTGLRLEEIEQQAKLKTQRAEIRSLHGLPKDAKLLLYTGRVSQEKNIPFLLDVFPKIATQESNTWLIVVGGGPKEKEYRQLAETRHKKIIFTGQKQYREVVDYCLAADVFVYASTTETQGLVLNEAKACGLPVVAVFGGGIADVVENGIDGYLLPQNPDIFVRHVVQLLRNDSQRRSMGSRAQKDSRNRFSSSVIAKRMESVYNSLIQRGLT
ncbi:MAG: glycosyltransferase [bacterium]